MPLVKSASKEALSKNIAREIKSGKPPAQAAAIGYAVQRQLQQQKPKVHK